MLGGPPSFMTKQANSIHPESRRHLAAYLKQRLRWLTFCLIKTTRKSAYTRKELPKSNGGVRTIHAVSGPLKKLQEDALKQLTTDFKPSAYAHGFTSKKSILTNAYVHQRSKIDLRIDLKDFFPSINFGRVRGMFMGPPFKFGEQAATSMAQMACLAGPEDTLPQGGVLSPYIANMLCRRLDARLAGLAKTWKCRFTRYADDCVFSTNDVNNFNAVKFTARITAIIEDEGFQLNHDKTRVMYPHERQMVTGIVVNDGINVNRRYYRSLRALLHNWDKHGIYSQLVRRKPFRDERNPGPRFELFGNTVYRLQGSEREYNKEQAKQKFARHVLGRILFLLRATNFVPPLTEGYLSKETGANRDIITAKRREALAKLPRSEAAQELLLKFYRLVSKPDENLIELKKIAKRHLDNYPVSARIEKYPQHRLEVGAKTRHQIRRDC